MKRYLLLVLLAFAFGPLTAQVLDPVKVSHTVKVVSDTEVDLQITAIMEEGWHIYTVHPKEGSFVIFTEVNIPKSKNYQLVGPLKETKPKKEYDPQFEETLEYHEKKGVFTQRIKVLSTTDFKLTAEFVYQVCNDRTCLTPVYDELEFKIKGAPKSSQAKIDPTLKTDEQKAADDAPVQASDIEPGTDPEKEAIDYAYKGEDTTSYEGDEVEADDEDVELGNEKEEAKSLWAIFFLCLGGGFAALLTPCVFPMVPMTVSFFTKQSKSKSAGIRNAIIYSICIILVYVILSAPFHIFESVSPSILNEVSTNVPLNIFFFVVFIVFAISFFGAFEITLPSSWINKADKASDRGGLIGIFFMSVTLVLVSFSCTGPLLGALLGSVLSTDGGPTALSVGMAGFGFGLALPFGLFAAFPSWLNSIPKSGGWLNSVKVVLGFLELALAFKFLSNADLVLQMGLLQREVFLAIWIGVFTALTFYLFGAFRMPHDSPVDKLSVPRMFFGLISLIFTIYLIPGLWGAPLKVISGFPPPSFYSESPNGLTQASSVPSASEDIPDGADPEHCPEGLNCFHDFETGLAYAKKVNKPILLDFTGWACVNCRKMEAQVWSDPKVLNILRNDVVLISLYVDERKDLAKEDQYKSRVTGRTINTVGKKWSDFQLEHFESNSQPQYIFLGHDSMKPLNGSTAYDPDIDLYVRWLEQGVKRFKKQASKK